MNIKTDVGKSGESNDAERSVDRKPSEILDDFEKTLKRKIKAFDLCVMDNKRALERVKDDLRTFLDGCRESLEHKFVELDQQVDLIEKAVENYENSAAQKNIGR